LVSGNFVRGFGWGRQDPAMEAFMRVLLVGGFALAAVLACSLPATAVTCDDVRALTNAEQDYWSQRLGLTHAQRHQIRLRCYGSGRRLNRPLHAETVN
jgi:hypothetical protein